MVRAALIPAVFLVPLLLGLLLPGRSHPLRLEIREEAGGPALALHGPPGIPFGIVAGTRIGPLVVAPRGGIFLALHPDDVAAGKGSPPARGVLSAAGDARIAPLPPIPAGVEVLLQAAAAPAGSGPEGTLLSNPLAVTVEPGGRLRVRSLRAHALGLHGPALAAGAAVAALFALGIIRRRHPLRCGGSIIFALGVAIPLAAGLLRFAAGLPRAASVFEGEAAGIARSFGQPFHDLVVAFRDLEARDARIAAVFRDVRDAHTVYAARLLAPRLRMTECPALPADLGSFAAVLALPPAPAPAGFRETLRRPDFSFAVRVPE